MAGRNNKFTRAKLFKRLDFSRCPNCLGIMNSVFNLLKVPEMIGQHKKNSKLLKIIENQDFSRVPKIFGQK
jgi:hypothetical protein